MARARRASPWKLHRVLLGGAALALMGMFAWQSMPSPAATSPARAVIEVEGLH